MKIGKLIGFSALAGTGYAAYKLSPKMKDLKATYNQVIAFNGEEKKYEEFDGDALAVLFGSLELDLSEAVMLGESATLKLYGEFCGIEILVPENWNVKVEGTHDKAGIDNSVDYDGEDDTSKLLIIDYDLKFAGLDIRDTSEKFEIEDEQDDDIHEMPDPTDLVDVEVEEASEEEEI